jgi:protocatechuate 4,5-dioxygenase alpha chain
MKGYWLNRAFNDLNDSDNRKALQEDVDAYLRRYPLSDEERRLVLAGDWQGCIDAGASVYTLTKWGAATGISLLAMGAQMRGMSLEAFQELLREQNDRSAVHALLPQEEATRG